MQYVIIRAQSRQIHGASAAWMSVQHSLVPSIRRQWSPAFVVTGPQHSSSLAPSIRHWPPAPGALTFCYSVSQKDSRWNQGLHKYLRSLQLHSSVGVFLFPCQAKCRDDPKNQNTPERGRPGHLSGPCQSFESNQMQPNWLLWGVAGVKSCLLLRNALLRCIFSDLGLLVKSMGTLSVDSFKLWISFLSWQTEAWQFLSPHKACQMACYSAKTYGDFWRGGGSLQRGTSQFCFVFRRRKVNVTRLLRCLLRLHLHFSND